MRPVAQVAQLVEQGIENPRVGGSIPSLGTKYPSLAVPSDSGNPEKPPTEAVFLCLAIPSDPFPAQANVSRFVSRT